MFRDHDLERWLVHVVPGQALCVFADDVDDARIVLDDAATSHREGSRVVTLRWDEVPPLANEPSLLTSALARAVVQFFPELYGLKQATSTTWSQAELETSAYEITRTVAGVQPSICRRILAACARGEPPALGKLPSAQQVHQLALAIDPRRLLVLIAVSNPPATGAALHALAQGAEWLASNSRGRVVLVLPAALQGRPELDHVSYAAGAHLAAESRPAVEGTRENGKAENALRGAARASPPGPNQAEVTVSPILGRPASSSDAEQVLYARLTSDTELRPLFSYNQRVKTRSGDLEPIVDVLWREGKLVIEVDGKDHRGEKKFAQDRQRDFELMMSGYQVVRFTSSRVIEDTGRVVEQIREAVKYLRERVRPS